MGPFVKTSVCWLGNFLAVLLGVSIFRVEAGSKPSGVLRQTC